MFYKKLQKKGTHPTPYTLHPFILKIAFWLLGGWDFAFGRMILCLRADDTLTSGGWYFGMQRMMFWMLLDDIYIREKMIFTSYTYYFWCNALGFNKLLVVGEPFLPTTILLPNPILFGIFAIFLSKKGFNRKQNFHPLEKMFLTIGNSASNHWKGCFQTLETNRADNDE